MTGSYAYTPQIWPSVLTVVLLVALAIFSWRRRAVPGARVFAVSCLIAVPWVAGAVSLLALPGQLADIPGACPHRLPLVRRIVSL